MVDVRSAALSLLLVSEDVSTIEGIPQTSDPARIGWTREEGATTGVTNDVEGVVRIAHVFLFTFLSYVYSLKLVDREGLEPPHFSL